MTVLDLGKLRQRQTAQQQQREEAISWTSQAIQEFYDAAHNLQTPTRGNPDFLKVVFGEYGKNGVWPILRQHHPENIIIEIGHGVALTRSGALFTAGKQSDLESAARWVAVRCGYSVDLIRMVIEDALLGDPWDSNDALELAPSMRANR